MEQVFLAREIVLIKMQAQECFRHACVVDGGETSVVGYITKRKMGRKLGERMMVQRLECHIQDEF